MLACRHGRPAIVELLLSHGADPNRTTAPQAGSAAVSNLGGVMDQACLTPLYVAAGCGHEDCVALLLGASAQVMTTTTIRV